MSKVVEQNTLKRRGVGLRACDPKRACPGFTLFTPRFEQNRAVYLIDLQGEVVHTWNLPYAPGLFGYLTERGTLFYSGRVSEDNFLSGFPFKGGVVLEADWNGNVLWELRHPDHHHIGILLRNGNVLLNCLGRVPAEIARRVKGGAEDHNLPSALYAPQPQEDAGVMYADYLAELTPAGQSVWEWRSWEHLDPVADGITEVQARHGKSRQPIAIVVEVRPKPLSLHSEIRPCLTGAPEDIQALAVASARAISSAL